MDTAGLMKNVRQHFE